MRPYLILSLLLFTLISCTDNTGEYVCTPCDLPCDKITYNEGGICPHCKMDLVKKSTLLAEEELVLNEVDIQNGSGTLLVEGGIQKDRSIIVHYYKPSALNSDSPLVIVLPGSGRNGDDYRDAWIEKANAYNILVVSLEYPEKHYPEFWSYNLAGMITDVEINAERTAMTSFKINTTPSDWLFGDFDRIFNLIKNEVGLKSEVYDVFGHSAGGQLLHRLAIFNPESLANRILSSNSGWYTVPTESDEFPTGLQGINISEKEVDFSKRLVLFLGEKDDVNETRGELRHTPELDKQGLHRLDRGKYFYNESMKTASNLDAEFNWQLEIVPNVGHDFKKMSAAAADYLYGEKH